MTERPTPRTDVETRQDEYDHVDSDFGPFAPSDFVSADFARELERELAEAKDEIARLNQSLKSASLIYDEAKEQRDRLAEALGLIVGNRKSKCVCGFCDGTDCA